MLLLFYLRLQLPGSEAKRNINKGFKIRAEFSNNTALQIYNTYKKNSLKYHKTFRFVCYKEIVKR